MDILPGTFSEDPAVITIEKESKNEFDDRLSTLLSDLEKNVLSLYLEGLTYVEMSELLNTHIKSIDNALMRVKKKIEKHYIKERNG